MTLLDEVVAQRGRQGGTCTVPGVVASLSPEDAADLQAAIDNPSIQATAIARALKARGLHLMGSTIQRHRRRACLCP